MSRRNRRHNNQSIATVYLDSASLERDFSYQRPVRMERVNKILAEFDPLLVNTLKVSLRERYVPGLESQGVARHSARVAAHHKVAAGDGKSAKGSIRSHKVLLGMNHSEVKAQLPVTHRSIQFVDNDFITHPVGTEPER